MGTGKNIENGENCLNETEYQQGHRHIQKKKWQKPKLNGETQYGKQDLIHKGLKQSTHGILNRQDQWEAKTIHGE